MSEIHPSEDKAALYLLGGLSEAERRDFEAELAASAELRALLRELEEATVLLARSTPQCQPPPKVWQGIVKNLAAGDTAPTKPTPSIWSAFWRQGWAAAAACLVGWLLYALLTYHPPASTNSGLMTATENSSINQFHTDSVAQEENNRATNRHNPAEAAFAKTMDPQELLRLRRQVTELQNRVTNLSQSVAQQQALLGESNRLKFFQLSSANGNSAPAPLSPALQRALFLAMARELGWLSSADTSSPGGGNAAFLSPGTNPSNVDFLDLRQATNGPSGTPKPQSDAQTSSRSPATDNSPGSKSAPIAIPAFTSGNNVVVAIDQSIVPTGTQLNFLNQDQQTLGTTTLGDNPMVITIPTSSGGPVFLTTGNLYAPINIFQFFNPGTSNP